MNDHDVFMSIVDEKNNIIYSELDNETLFENIGGTELGQFYDVLIFRVQESDEKRKMYKKPKIELIDYDIYSAIFVDPRYYFKMKFDEGYCFIVFRKTEKSLEPWNECIRNFKELYGIRD